MIYIYLNTYDKGYLYVGSHKWDGEGIDPNYHGSSAVAKRYGWIPIKEEILEVVTPERKLVAEREWIEKYCSEYGIAHIVKEWAKMHNNAWVQKYKDGLMLNAHSNSAYQMYANGHSKEAVKKQAASRALWAKSEEGRAIIDRSLKATKTKEALQNYSKTRIESRLRYKLSDGFRGDYIEIASHIGINESSCRKWLKGQRNLPKRFGEISAVQIPR